MRGWSFGHLGDSCDGALWAGEEGSAGGIGTHRVEPGTGLLVRADAGGLFRWVEVIDEFGTDDEEAVVAFAVLPVVGYRGVIGVRECVGECPSFTGVGGEGEVGAVLVGMFVVSAGDYTVRWVVESYGEDAGGVGAVEDRGVEDLPRLSAVGRMKNAGHAAAGGEPDVRVGG